ncbi:MAG: TonB-dependent receptor [Hyphomicrobium sp.]
MPIPAVSRRRATSRSRKLEFAAASALSLVALSAILSAARAQQAQPAAQSGNTLPPVVVEQKKSPATATKQAAPKPAEPDPEPALKPKQAAKPKGKGAAKAEPAAQPQPVADEPAPPQSPAQALQTLPAASAAAASAKLELQNTTGSALNLTPRETPATVTIVSQKDIEEKGARGLVETLRTIPGIHVSNNPGEVGTTVTRGFQKATGYSVDGSRVADPVFLPRDFSSYHFDRIEVLRGPASVVSGTSGLAGTFNIVTKQASTERTFGEAMVSYGSFGTLETGIGLNVAISPNAAIRSTATFSKSDGYVDDTPYDKYGITTNILLKPTDALKLTASVDYFKDDLSPYYGTPLIQRSVARSPTDVVSSSNGLVLDKSIRYKNYDFLDTIMTSESVWLRGAADYKLNEYWKIRNEASYYSADRLWRDADFYSYTGAPAPAITRGITLISHDHEFWSDRLTASFDGRIGGMRNRFTAGAEYLETSFGTNRHFGTAPSVDIFNPNRGTYPAETVPPFSTLQKQTSSHATKAAFAEHAINLTPSWLIAAGIRRETIELDRNIFNKVSGATQTFGTELGSTTWRVGSTYEIMPGTTLFGQYATAVTPVSALMVASLANSRFDLTTGNSLEFGIKSTMLGGRVTSTASVYQIEQDDIVTRNPANPSQSIQGGSQRSRGIEVETAVSLTDRWNLSLSGTVIDTEFTELFNSAGKSLAGNRPVNAVPWAWHAMMTYRLEALPATIGAQLTGVGPFYTSNANLYEAKERTVLDAWIAFDLGKGTLRIRGRNLTDELYAEGTDYSETSLYIAPPRSFDVTYSVKW